MTKKKKVAQGATGGKQSSSLDGAPGVKSEKIVAVPQVDTYSELPFAIVEKAGKQLAASTTPVSGKRKAGTPPMSALASKRIPAQRSGSSRKPRKPG